MNDINYGLGLGDALTQFVISQPIAKRFGQFEDVETMEDKLNYQFKNGFVDVGDLPCRKHFWQQMAERVVHIKDKADCSNIYFANGKRKVDFSGFIYIPTHVQHWAETQLVSPQQQVCRFKLSTCGGVRIWVNGVQQVQFTPFKRNQVSHTEISLSLTQGCNQILLHAEDLFERDTQYFFELSLLDDIQLKVQLANINPEHLQQLEQMLSGLVYNLNLADHTLVLQSDTQFLAPLLITGQVTGMSNEEETNAIIDGHSVKHVQSSVQVQLPRELKPAHYAVSLNFEYQGIKLKKICHVNILNEQKAPQNNTLTGRKLNALNYTASEGMNITGKLLARLATHAEPELSRKILERTLQKISLREDCSDFWMVSVLWAWQMSAYTQLPDNLWRRVKSSILGYRYWLDEPGNDAMWFWSENHVLCFHVSQLLAGQFFPQAQFLCSGRQGQQQKEIATKRLNLWFDQVLNHGLTEWNSSCYYPIDYIGLLAIYELSDNEELKCKAKTLMDRLMLMSALHFQNGVASGTMGRVYEKELMANEMTELAGFGQVAWGNGWHTRMCASLPMFCLSQYEPPALSNQIASMSKLDQVEAYYTQGLNKAAKICVWKQTQVMLSSAVDHLTGQAGHQQHVLDIQFAKHPKARVWINHPGEETPGGEGRPSYWAGNGVMPRVMQHQNSAMMIYKLTPETRVKYTHLYLPNEVLDQVHINTHWCLLKSGQAYAVIGCDKPIELVTKGLTRGQEIRAYATECAWYVEVGQLSKGQTFAQMINLWQASQINFKSSATNLVGTVQTPNNKTFQLNWQGECLINQMPWTFPQDAGLNPIIKE